MKLLVSQSKCSGTRTLRYQQFEMNLDSEISGVYCIKVKKVKVSHSLIAVGAVGVRVPLYLGHS